MFQFLEDLSCSNCDSCLQALAPISARSDLYDMNFDFCLSISVWQFFFFPTLRPLPKDTEGHCKRRLPIKRSHGRLSPPRLVEDSSQTVLGPYNLR